MQAAGSTHSNAVSAGESLENIATELATISCRVNYLPVKGVFLIQIQMKNEWQPVATRLLLPSFRLRPSLLQNISFCWKIIVCCIFQSISDTALSHRRILCKSLFSP
jgi:hypothetical protein